ncbi:MAG: 4-alpha-glucanotransferase [Prevotella sp.]|nr:4-alpha-glucanotransferase [Prevotella sp.]
MKLNFSIHYRTAWGQQLVVLVTYKSQDSTSRTTRVPMLTADGEQWTAETAVVESRRSPVLWFTYIYIVEDSDGHELRREWNGVARTYPFDASKSYRMDDCWRDIPLPAHLYTSAYRVTTGQGENTEKPLPENENDGMPPRLPLFRRTVMFRVSAPQIEAGQAVAVVGSHPALGAWNPARYQLMEQTGLGDWMYTLNVDWVGLPLEYKYVVVDSKTQQLVAWEEGDNRYVPDSLTDGEVYVACGEPLRICEKPWRVAGVCVPVSALRSEHSCGVGDFGDLYSFIDWAKQVGLKVIQLLPVNDTAGCHPYNITSAFRLHPQYIDLNQLPPLKDKRRATAFRRQQRELNALGYTDYEAVERVKTEYLKALYDEQQCAEKFTFSAFIQHHLHQQLKRAADHARSLGIALMGDLPVGLSRDSEDIKEHPQFFCTDCNAGTPPDSREPQGNNWGLPTYNWPTVDDDTAKAAQQPEETFYDWMNRRLTWMEQYFDALRIDHALGYFRIWEIPTDQVQATMGHFSPALPLTAGEIDYFGLPFRRDFLTQPFISDRVVDRIFGIHAQYVRDTFLTQRPYGLYALKEEVSTQRRIEQLFSGRNDENSLWIRDGLYRLVSNVLFIEDQRQPDMFHPRIMVWQEPVFEALSSEERDAFMRIYNNYYYQRHSMFWGSVGYKRLGRLAGSTHMLLCAEDLGPQPDCVAPVLDALRIPSLEVQQMPKQAGMEFAHLDANPVRSVATITTHDMAPLRLWWQEQPEQAQRYYTTMLQKQGRAPEQLPAHLAEEIIARHLYCPSMLCILSLQDWLAMDQELRSKQTRQERINTPGDPFNRWQWRMHITIEQLAAAEKYNKKLHTMIVRSKRS